MKRLIILSNDEVVLLKKILNQVHRNSYDNKFKITITKLLLNFR